jgi:tetratricopeptide (TPR) repeat protein
VAADPRFSEGWFYLGNYYLANGDMRKAWNTYDRGVHNAPGCIVLFDKPEFLINQSFAAAQCNDFYRADSVMRIAQQCSPAGMQSDIAYIRAYIAKSLFENDTVIALLAGKEENLQRPEACRLLADAYTLCGRKKEAEAMYSKQLYLESNRSR